MREILSRGDDVRIVGFIDDDPRKAGSRVGGYPVLGGYSALIVLLKATLVEAVVISAQSLPPERLNNLEVVCGENSVELSRLRVGLERLVSVDADDSQRLPRSQFRQIGS